MGIERVTADVYRIGMGYVSAYLIAQEAVTVIDTGLPKHREIILEAASKAGRKADEVKHILLTHHHADHTGSLAELLAATSAKAYIHPLDAPIVRGEKPAPGPNRDVLAGRVLGPLSTFPAASPANSTPPFCGQTNERCPAVCPGV